MDDIALFYEKCKRHGLKITPQRTAVYKALMGSRAHPSADAVHQAIKTEFPNISLDTVNRTLITLSDIGVIDVVEGQGGPRRFDPNLELHHHFHCVSCGEITDFYDAALDDVKPPELLEKNCTIIGKRVVFKGYCGKCRTMSQQGRSH